MTRCWRLCAARFAATAFSGEGARLAGGRWNSPGVAVVYVAESRALALLEQLVHFDPDFIPPAFVVLPVDIPGDVAIEAIDPARLAVDLPPDACRRLGDDWARELRTAVLPVPSAVVPAEWNYVLNPAHPEFGRLIIRERAPFAVDRRLRRLR